MDLYLCSITSPKKSEKSVGEIKTGGNSSPRISPDRCQLSSWGLPESVLKQYEKIGINTMFEWQAECLCTGNVLNGGRVSELKTLRSNNEHIALTSHVYK